MKHIFVILVFTAGLGLFAPSGFITPAARAETYETVDEFVGKAFAGQPPKPKFLWIKKEMRPTIDRILIHNRFRPLRVRYWRTDKRTVWILEDIGKYQPITTGFIVNDGTLESLKVLIYRESHGWEVKHDFFTKQFQGLTLDDDHRLSDDIDGISGATMSVNTLKNLARLALYFHKQALKP